MKATTLKVIEGLHRIYKLVFSPLFGNVCRFQPPCSDYAVLALKEHGFIKGSLLAFKRVIRCNPFCQGGYDPVPPCSDIEHKHINDNTYQHSVENNHGR